MVTVIDRSTKRAPSCHYQLTDWVDGKDEIQFAIDQLDKHHAPWLLKSSSGKVAVFVPGKKESDGVEQGEDNGK
jgi:hypothetical protein